MGYNAVQSVESEPKFRTNISPPSSGSKISQAELVTSFHANFSLGLFFDHDDGDDMLLRNFG
jgi:hypothetical protein